MIGLDLQTTPIMHQRLFTRAAMGVTLPKKPVRIQTFIIDRKRARKKGFGALIIPMKQQRLANIGNMISLDHIRPLGRIFGLLGVAELRQQV